MEVTSDIRAVEQVIMYFERIEGTGSLTQRIDEYKLNEIIKALKENLSSPTILTESSLRKISFFLLLNTNLSVSDSLLDDFDIGHLVNRRLSGEILLKLVWGLSLEKYLLESIVYCPPALSLELIDIAVQGIKYLEFTNRIDKASNLAIAIYKRVTRINSFSETIDRKITEVVYSKLFTNFEILIQLLYLSKSERSASTPQEVLTCTGKQLRVLLKVTSHCMDFYLKNSDEASFEEYKVTFEYNYSQWNSEASISLPQFDSALLTACLNALQDISVDLWCDWCETDSDISGKNLQKVIGEDMYVCLSSVKSMSEHCVMENSSQISNLIAMLMTMAIKPWDEDDEIKDADLNLVLANIFNESKSQDKWLTKLFEIDERIFCDERCIESIVKCIKVIKFEQINLILDRVVTALESKNELAYNKRLKKLALDLLQVFSLDEQSQIVASFFRKYDDYTLLFMDDFHTQITEVFNKAVLATKDGKNEFFAEYISLCFQSPDKLFIRMLLEGMTNANQTALVIEVFKILQPVCGVRARDDKRQMKDGNLLTTIIMEIMERPIWTEQEKDNFNILVSALISNAIISKTTFIECCLLPCLHQTLATHNWQLLLIFLQTLQNMFEETADVNIFPVLYILAQVLQSSRCDLITFSPQIVFVCEKTSIIVRSILSRLSDTERCARDVNWLRNKLSKLPMTGVNKPYFKELMSKEENQALSKNMFNSILCDVIQHDVIQRDETNAMKILRESENERMMILQSLVEMLPMLTAREWKCLPRLKKLIESRAEDSSVSLLHLLTEALMIICSVVSKEFANNESALTCLSFCIRNLGCILQDDVLPRLTTLPLNDVKMIFRKCVFLLECLPSQIKEPCSIFFITILMRMISEVHTRDIEDGTTVTENITQELCSIISMLSVSEARIALSRRLAEICYKSTL